MRRASPGIGVLDRDCALEHDDPVVHCLVDEVHRAAGHLGAELERLGLRLEPGKARQQAGVHVQDAIGKRRDELGRDDAHIAGQADQLDLVLLQLGDEGQVAFHRASSGDGDVMGSDPELPRRDQTRCIGLVRKHDGDLDAFESTRRDGRVDGEKVRPAP